MAANGFTTQNVNYNITADGGFAWTVNYDLSFLSSVFLATIRINLVGDTASASVRTTWETGIETIWDNKVFFSDGTQLYAVQINADFVSTGQNQTVTVHDSSGRYDMTNWYTTPQGWGVAYLDEAAAHEIGHMLGNYDEYTGGATHDGFTTTGTLMSDLTVAGFYNNGYFASIDAYAEGFSGSILAEVAATVGGSGADALNGDGGMNGFYGFGGNDTINGRASNDYMDGGDGFDTAVFSGNRSSYTATTLANGTVRVSGSDGTDTLVSIEQLQFGDMTISLAAEPPVATINDHTLNANQWAQVSNWLSYSDANGNAATQYQFWDGGAGANSGYFWTPSNAHNPANTTIEVAASDLASAWVRGGTAGGSETMYVRAFDGTDWSAWDAFNFTTIPNGQTLIGTADSDTFTGGEGNDRLEGGEGMDFLTGGAGADQLVGGAGTDFLYVDAEDTLIDGGDGFDYVYLDTSKSYGANFKVAGTNIECVSGTAADDVIDASGVAYGTVLFGNYGNDVLIGGAGSDGLMGSVGVDTLTGGAANDTFYFGGAWGEDTVTDFTRGQDVLDMTGVSGLTGISQLAITDTAEGASIAYGADSILLQGVTASSLTASDFHFV